MITNFSFLENFDVIPQPKVAAEPTYTYDHIQAAKDSSFAQGIEQGRQEALSGLESNLLEIITGVIGQIEDLYRQQREWIQKIYADSVSVAAAIAQKHAQTEAEHKAIERCILFVESTLSCLLEKTSVVLTVNPELLQPLKRHLENRGVLLEGDETLDVCSSRLTWENGGAQTSIARIQYDIDQHIKTWFDSQKQEILQKRENEI